MITLGPRAGCKYLAGLRHIFRCWQNSVLPDQSGELHPKRNESGQVNRPEAAGKRARNEKVLVRLGTECPNQPSAPGTPLFHRHIAAVAGLGDTRVLTIIIHRVSKSGS